MSKIDYIIGYLFLMLAFSIPFNTITGDSVLIITILALSIFNSYKKFNLTEVKLFINKFFPFLLFFVVLLTGLLYTEDLSKGLRVIERSLSFIIFPIIFYINKTNNKLQKLPHFFFMGVIVTAIGCNFFQLVKYGNPFKFGFSQLLALIEIDPTYFSMYAIMAIAIGLFAILKSSFKSTIFYILVVLYLSYFVIALGSKSSLVVLVMVIMFCLLHLIKKTIGAKYLFLLPLIFLLFLILTYNHPLTYKRFYEPLLGNNFDFYQMRLKFIGNRYYFWKCAVENLSFPNIIFGYGTGDEISVLSPCYDHYRLKTFLNPHNIYFSVLLKVGLIGFIPFILSVIYGLKKITGQKLFAIFSTIIIIMGLVESLLDRAKGIVFFGLFSAYFIMTTINKVYLTKRNLQQ